MLKGTHGSVRMTRYMSLSLGSQKERMSQKKRMNRATVMIGSVIHVEIGLMRVPGDVTIAEGARIAAMDMMMMRDMMIHHTKERTY